MNNPNNMKKRGFGSMDKAKAIEAARKGGINAHKKGTAHEWTSETARKHFNDKKETIVIDKDN